MLPKILTDKQIKRQDFVDNQIFELIKNLSSHPSQIKWDIEIIGEVRDVIRKYLAHKVKTYKEMGYYPYLK